MKKEIVEIDMNKIRAMIEFTLHFNGTNAEKILACEGVRKALDISYDKEVKKQKNK